MSPPAVIEWTGLVRAAGLLLLAALVSVGLRLDLERRLLWAGLRAAAQLFLLGEVLGLVLDRPQALVTFAVMAVMIAAAAHQTATRPQRRLPGAGLGSFITLALTGLLTTWLVTRGVLGLDPWYTPRYALPLLGMILGNGLTGLALTLDRMMAVAHEQRAQIEADLALGASRYEALRRPMADAVRVGMMPIINATSVVGLVSIPGMMTGQILAGADPKQAVRYQLVVMFMVTAATALGSTGLAVFSMVRLTDRAHRLRGP